MSAELEQIYSNYYSRTQDPKAAAIMCLTEAVFALAKSTGGLKEKHLGHEICMGIRHGLFGAGATNNTSISLDFSDVADALQNKRE